MEFFNIGITFHVCFVFLVWVDLIVMERKHSKIYN